MPNTLFDVIGRQHPLFFVCLGCGFLFFWVVLSASRTASSSVHQAARNAHAASGRCHTQLQDAHPISAARRLSPFSEWFSCPPAVVHCDGRRCSIKPSATRPNALRPQNASSPTSPPRSCQPAGTARICHLSAYPPAAPAEDP